MADMRYGTKGSCQTTQNNGRSYGVSCDFNYSNHSHLDALEFFDPNLAADPFHWIPKGLYEDLIDANNTNDPVLNDNVSGYTNQQMFNAFNSSITTLQGYRTNLLNTTTNTTSGSVVGLFQQYGYGN